MTTSETQKDSKDRRVALEWYRRGRIYDALDLGWKCLRANPDDVGVRNLILAGCVKIGLSELAVETAEGLPDEIVRHPEVVKALAALRSLPRARVAWSCLNEQFRGNLAVLVRRSPEMSIIGSTWKAGGPDGIELYRSADGNYQICRRDETGLPVWWPKLGNHTAEAKQADTFEVAGFLPPPFLFEGLGTHALFDRVCRRTRHTFMTYSPFMYVVEPDLPWAAAALHLYDWRDILSQDRVLFFIGPAAVEAFGRYLLTHEQSDLPGHRIHYVEGTGVLHRLLDDMLKEVRETRARQSEALGAELIRLYEPRGPRFLAERFNRLNPSDPLRIMLLASRYTTVLQYTIRDLADGFRALGCLTEVVMEDYDAGCLLPLSYRRRLLAFRPDLVVIPDHIRAEREGTFPPQVVVATWMQDRMPYLFTPDAGQAVRTTCTEPGEPDLTAPTDYVFGYFKKELVDRFGYPAETFLSYPLIPSNPRTYRPVEVTPEQAARYTCEVAFLSHGGEPCEQALTKLLDQFDPVVRPVVEAVFETVRDRYRQGGSLLCSTGTGAQSQLRKVADAIAVDRGIDPALMADFDGRFNLLNDRLWRHATLEWLVDLGVDLRLYGQGWGDHPTFRRFARPPVNDPVEVCAVYRCAKVNLQVGAYGAMHQRLIHGLFAGGFFLARESTYNYGVFDDRNLEEHTGPATAAQRQAALSALVELGRRGCDSFDDFTSSANRPLVEVLRPVVGEMLTEPERADLQALWEVVSLLLLVVPHAVFPGVWEEVAFWSRDDLADRLDRFCRREPHRREELARSMRERCLGKYGPEPMAERLLRHIGGCLARAVDGVLTSRARPSGRRSPSDGAADGSVRRHP